MRENRRETVIIEANIDCPPHDPSISEKELMKAVLESAIIDLREAGYVEKQARRFFLNFENEHLYSFRSICQYLNINPKEVLEFAGLKDDELFMNSYMNNQRRVRALLHKHIDG